MWYVIQTTTGKEEELTAVIKKRLSDILFHACFFMQRKHLKRLGGQWREITETLFPAYVFLDTDCPETVFYELKKVPEFAKLLGDNCGTYIPLEPEETDFLKKLIPGDGSYQTELTTVRFDSTGKPAGFQGPLSFFEDRILKLNLRKRYALIELTICGQKRTAMLGIRLESDGKAEGTSERNQAGGED